MKIDIPRDIVPIFANGVTTNFKDDEIIFTFLHTAPNIPAKVKAIISMTPKQAKRFREAVNQTIKMFEDKHEEIKLPEKPEKHTKGIEVA